MDISDACDRIKNASLEDWTAYRSCLTETCEYLASCLQKSLVNKRSNITTAPQDGRVPGNHSEIIRTSSGITDSTAASSVPSGFITSSEHPAPAKPAKQKPTTAPKVSSSISRKHRIRDNILRNARNREKALGESNIFEILSKRFQEFRPARAGFDIASPGRHSPQRIAFYLDGYLGAMYIAERYHTYRKTESSRQGKRRGKPKHMYKEFAESVGIKDPKLTQLIELGNICLQLRQEDAALLLFPNLPGTMRRLSKNDISELAQLVRNDERINRVIKKWNDSVNEAYILYSKVARDVWSRDVARALQIQKIMESNQAAETTSRRNTRNRAKNSREEPAHNDNALSHDTPLSDQLALSPRLASPSYLPPHQHNTVDRAEGQNRVSECNTHTEMNILLKTARRQENSLEFEGEKRSVTTMEANPERSCKRRRVDDEVPVEVVEALGTLAPITPITFSDGEERYLGDLAGNRDELGPTEQELMADESCRGNNVPANPIAFANECGSSGMSLTENSNTRSSNVPPGRVAINITEESVDKTTLPERPNGIPSRVDEEAHRNKNPLPTESVEPFNIHGPEAEAGEQIAGLSVLIFQY
ncbi:hypothetical protein H2204_015605 [Knufia peltigerae]|uniref:Uncharacterized protein n=1 Tax=Knufia peltigerae TaxID=1002370 RepID=A0AA39CI90_9EURO|nr:hypothetical protein H2204_015605 [Knufia peltigerae]